MASPYTLSNADLQFLNCSGQDFTIHLAFLNPIAITTSYSDINMDALGNWQPPPNFDTAAARVAPYAPVANLGPNRIGFVNEPLYFCGMRSYQRMDFPVVSYAWSATGSPVVTNYANGAQVGFVWPSPGLYTVTLTVTDRAGTPQSSTRQVMIYQDRTSSLPGMITLSGPSGSLDQGGWQCQITTVNSQFSLYPPDALPIGTYQPMVLLVETRYEIMPGVWVNRTVGPLGQFNPGYPYEDPRILFDGYVQTGSVHQDVDKDTLSFSCTGLQMVLNDAKAHMIGYYNCDYTSVDNNGVPQGCKPSSLGKGFMVGRLTTNDVIISILQYHSNIAQHHDVHMWNNLIPCAPFGDGTINAYYYPWFSTLTVNEGSIWQDMQDLCNNEWSQVYCERDGSIRVGPQINYRGQEYWMRPQLYNTNDIEAGTYINLIQDLGYTIPQPPSIHDATTIPATMPMLPSQPMPIYFVHSWGSQLPPSPYFRPFQGQPDPNVFTFLNSQAGPPLLCTFSDTPVFDSASLPPSAGLFPSAYYNWPQDLALYPVAIDAQENYTGRTSLVKLIGTMANQQTILTSWYPQNTFQVASDGTSTIVTATLPAGNWDIDQGHVLPDVTVGLNRTLILNWWWEMAHRVFYAQNVNYQATITMGMLTCLNLNDLAGVTRQNNALGPRWLNKPFFVDGINYQIDINAKTWSTSITLNEITSANIGPIQKPPVVIPKW